MLAEAQAGTLLVTLTAHLRSAAADLQPLIGTATTGTGTTGDPPIPRLSTSSNSNPAPFNVSAFDVKTTARVFIDGQPVTATLACGSGSTGGVCNDGLVSIDLASKPAVGQHLIQVHNPSGRLSNELPFCIGNAADCNTDD